MTVVTEHLEHRGIRFEVLPHPPATSALGEALALGIDPEQVIKTVVLDLDTGHALAVLPANRRVDLDLVREVLGDEHVTLASEREIERDFPEFELGALPPLPSMMHVPVVIDPTVFAHRRITFAAGTQREAVRTDPEGLFTGASVDIAPISRPMEGEGVSELRPG
jgi:Ala-tRNA(Pro) deacylase